MILLHIVDTCIWGIILYAWRLFPDIHNALYFSANTTRRGPQESCDSNVLAVVVEWNPSVCKGAGLESNSVWANWTN